MGRMAVASERMPSQRATAEVRGILSDLSEEQRKEEQLEKELAGALAKRDQYESRCKDLEQQLKSIKPTAKAAKIRKIKTQPVMDTHASELCSELMRYDKDDAVPLVMLALLKLEKHWGVALRTRIKDDTRFAHVLQEILWQHTLRHHCPRSALSFGVGGFDRTAAGAEGAPLWDWLLFFTKIVDRVDCGEPGRGPLWDDFHRVPRTALKRSQ